MIHTLDGHNGLLCGVAVRRAELIVLLALHDAGLAYCVNAVTRPVADFDIVSEGLFGNHVRFAAEYLIQPVKHGGSLLTGDGLVRTEGAVLVAGDNAECGGIVHVRVVPAVGELGFQSRNLLVGINLVVQVHRQLGKIFAGNVQLGIGERLGETVLFCGSYFGLGPAAVLLDVGGQQGFAALAIQQIRFCASAACADKVLIVPENLVEVMLADKFFGFRRCRCRPRLPCQHVPT